MDDHVKFNTEFLYGNNKRISLKNIFNLSVDQFVIEFESRHQELGDILNQNLLYGEKIDSKPYLFEMNKMYIINLEKEYNAILSHYKKNNLSTPLKSFFGGITKRHSKVKKHPILILNEMVNIEQLRVIYNSMSNPVTFVQGPPGTGKTQTILNVILSAFYNGLSVLVSSNNNLPVDNIIEKFNELYYNNQLIPFPLFRLGNYNAIKESMKVFNEFYYRYRKIDIHNDKIENINQLITGFDELVDSIDLFETIEALEEELSALEKLYERTKLSVRSLGIKAKIDSIQNDLKQKQRLSIEDLKKLLKLDSNILLGYLFYSSIKRIQMLDNDKYIDIKNSLIFAEKHTITYQDVIKFKRVISGDGIKRFKEIFPIILSTNISCNYIGKPAPIFDLTIIDEAGQCNPATSLIPIIRGKRLVLVGDTNQLQPIVNIDEKFNNVLLKKFNVPIQFDYKHNSILHVMQKTDLISKSILLKNHYRCSKKIIHFSNEKYYEGNLEIMTKDEPNSLLFKSVNSENSPKNISLKEIASVISEIKSSNTKDIGVITPFRLQANEIRKRLKESGMEDIPVGTVHTFQGHEKEKIIFSLAINKNTSPFTFNWVRNNVELLNVATTRAKKQLVMIADEKQINKLTEVTGENAIYELMSYIKKNGEFVLSDDSTEDFRNSIRRGKLLFTKSEEEFFATVEHILGLNEDCA